MSFKRIFHYYALQAKKYQWSFYFLLVAYGVGVILSDILNPLLYKQIIDLISGGTPSALLARELFSVFFIIIFVVLGYQIFYRIGDYLIAYFEANVMREISNDTFSRLMNHSYKFFSNNFSGSIVAKSKRFTASFESIIDNLSFNFWITFVQMAGVFVVLFWNVPKVGFLILGWSVVYVIITVLFIRKKFKYDLLKSNADSRVTGSFTDAITNILNIKIFSGRNKEHNLFKEVTSDEYVKRKRAWYFGNFQSIVQGLLMAILQIATIYLMISLWLKGSISTGMVVLVQIYIFGVFDRLWNLGIVMVRFFQSVAEAKEMADIFDVTPDILDPKNPEKLKIKEGYIVFQDVNFEYQNGQKLLNNFNLEIKPGESIGIVGHSGAGKTTITKLLLRFSDISKGTITIDGQNIKNLNQDDLRSAIAYVPQEPILFHRSIRENIAYGKPSATEEEIIEVAKKAHAHEFIMKLAQGYDTRVGERGIKLSGGERQRVAIARAMLKSAPIIMLDEATSSLDSVSESYIHDAFKELMKGKTTLVIAHRLSTVQEMNRIIVLDKGKIAEQGSHKELLEKKGIYADLWEHQTGGFLK